MAPYTSIVVGTDGSSPARDAVEVAGAIAAACAIPVTVVAAWKHEVAVPGAREEPWADLATRSADVDLNAHGVTTIEQLRVEGDAAQSLIDAASERPDALIVVGARGLGRAPSRIVGSTSNDLSHHSTADVLFVHSPNTTFRVVALATDGSETAMRAVETGYALAVALGAKPVLVTAARDTDSGTAVLDEVEQTLRGRFADARPERRVLVGNAADVLVAGATNDDLMVIGNRGMSGFARVLGSTANTITHQSTTSLLLVNTTRAL